MRYTNTGSEPGTSEWPAKGNPEEMFHANDLNRQDSVTLSYPFRVSVHEYCTFSS